MATLYTQQSKNIWKTWFLMSGFCALVIAIGFFFSQYYGDSSILYFFVLFSIIMNIASYWFSDKIALRLSHARELKREESPELWNIVQNLAITAGLPMPRLFLIEDSAPNAFATGRNKEHAVVGVTTGLLRVLDKTELEGVIAHELSHIGNRDILISTVAVVLAGFISIAADFFLRSTLFGGHRDREKGNGVFMLVGIALTILAPIFATLIQLAVSRKREFLADASGALITRYPEGLASALRKISDNSARLAHAHKATAHLFIANPFGDRNALSRKISGLFSTHPHVEDRIKALLEG